MEKFLFKTEFIDFENGASVQADYWIVVDKLSPDGDEESYGTAITLKGCRAEEITVSNITVNSSEIIHFVQMLADNHVTPVSLPYILEDWLGTCNI